MNAARHGGRQLVLALALLCACLAQAQESLGTSLLADCRAAAVGALPDLAAAATAERDALLALYPPADYSFVHRVGAVLVPIETKGFPEDFLATLQGVEELGVAVYPVLVSEDAQTRERVFRNLEGKEAARVAAPAAYDPAALACSVYGTPPATLNSVALARWYAERDPSRVHLLVWLATPEAAALYEAARAEAAEERRDEGGGLERLLWDGSSVSDLTLTGVEALTNGMRVTLAYPWDGGSYPTNSFTNRVDFFVAAELQAGWWDVAFQTNVSAATNWIAWLDVSATNQRFYAAGNADLDSDADSLSDAREVFVYHSSPTNTDTDADGWGDYFECVTNRTDPANADTQCPAVTILWPTNSTRRVWVP
jgi:hypothetical protein